MLFDVIDSYDKQTINHLCSVRRGIIQDLIQHEDAKKIAWFLAKCCVLGTDENKKQVHIGIPNVFVESQVKKFFKKPITNAIQATFEPSYKPNFVIYSELQSGNHALQIAVTEMLPNSANKKTPDIQFDATITKELGNYFGILFDPQYSFERFVVGSHNELAHSAAQAIAQKPGEVYNPFFIYGEVGLGKTHLMQAIGNYIIDNNPDKVVLYLPTSTFIDKVINAVRKWSLGQLQQKLQEVDVLMLDDIQFLAGKERTQEIFHNIFNQFYADKKQIVLTSDRPPKSLTLLEARLQSRFALGLVADIKAPDLETRIAILQEKLKEKALTMDVRHLELIAQTVNTNIRELEGALNIVVTRLTLLNKELTDEDILEALQTLGFKKVPKPRKGKSSSSLTGTAHNTYEAIVTYIAEYFGLMVSDLTGSWRKKEISRARQLSMYIAKKHFSRSLQKIGNYFGGKNHASVIYAINICEELLETDPQLSGVYTEVKSEFGLS